MNPSSPPNEPSAELTRTWASRVREAVYLTGFVGCLVWAGIGEYSPGPVLLKLGSACIFVALLQGSRKNRLAKR